MKYFSPLIILPFLAAFILSACEKERVYQQYRKVAGEEWTFDDQKSFKIDITDTTSNYNLLVQLRHKGNYPYSNIWIKLYEESPQGEESWTRYNLPLAEKSGQWKGQGLGDIIDHEFLVKQEFMLPRSGTYIFTLKHDMRSDSVPDILDVGLRLDRVVPR